MNLKSRVARLESRAGPSRPCPCCGRLVDAAELHRRDPHSPEALAERRRLERLPPDEFRAEYRAAFGHDMDEQPEPPPDKAVYEPRCWRCGAVTGPGITWGELRQLPNAELVRLFFEAL